MLEIPEARVIAQQLRETTAGKQIEYAEAGRSPHKYAWYCGDPGDYAQVLTGKSVVGAQAAGGMVEMFLGDDRLLFADGVVLRYHLPKEAPPPKHQLLLRLSDGAHLSASVQMYGGIWSFKAGTFDNPYYDLAISKPDPLGQDFTWEYFASIFAEPGTEKISAKAFLATDQRIPGLGNGVLQDILFVAGIHPKRKIMTLSDKERDALYRAVVQTLRTMTRQGGRDTERDLLGQPGGYMTKMSRLTVGTPCPNCGETIQKAAYMGGSIYFCPACQPYEGVV